MDILGPLPITENGNEYILTIQDLLTKYSVAVPLIQIQRKLQKLLYDVLFVNSEAPKQF